MYGRARQAAEKEEKKRNLDIDIQNVRLINNQHHPSSPKSNESMEFQYQMSVQVSWHEGGVCIAQELQKYTP